MLYKFVQSLYTHIRYMDITDFTVCGITHFLNIVLNPVIVIKPLFRIGRNNQRFVSTGFGRRTVNGQLDLHARLIDKSFINVIQVLHGLPVNGDLEDGFGPAPEDCALTVRASIAAGLAGLGIEDTTADPQRPIHDFDAAVARVSAAASEAHGRIVLTGRTDNYLHGRTDLDDTIRRLTAFAEAGADVLYAPCLPDMDSIVAVVRAVAPKPVNVLIGPEDGEVTLAQLSAAGVKRISVGGALYRRAMTALVQAAEGLSRGELGAARGAIPGSEIASLMPQ